MSAQQQGPSVVIVGAGLFGLTTALHLARLGHRVTVLEAGTAAGATTAAGAGFVGLWAAGYAWYWNESERDLEQYGIDFYRSLDAAGHDISLRDTGNAWLAVTDEGYRDHILDFDQHPLRPAGSRLLTADAAAELIPGLDRAAVTGGFFQPGGIQISAPDAGLALAAQARAEGVQIVEHSPVAAIEVENGQAVGVRSALGEVTRADAVVIAAGSWSNELLAPLGRELPFSRVIASRLTTSGFGLGAIPTLMLPELAGLWVREHQGGVTYGSGAGYERIAEQDRPASPRPDEPDLLDAMRAALAPVISRLLPASAPVVDDAAATQGVVSYTADRRFIAGRIPEAGHLYVAAGDNESGVTHGPGIGRLVAELVSTGESTLGQAELYDPARFPAQAYADELAVAAAMPARRYVDAVARGQVG